MSSLDNWTNDEIENLNRLVGENNLSILQTLCKWKVISVSMTEMGFQRSAKHCRDKFPKKIPQTNKSKSTRWQMDRSGESEVVWAVQSPPEQLEGDLQKYPRSDRQIHQKPIFCLITQRS